MLDISHSTNSPSVLFQNKSQSLVVIDIPRSIEEAQVRPGRDLPRRLISTLPAEVPFATPEPKNGFHRHDALAPSAQLTDLMTTAAVKTALDELQQSYAGPWCLPRITKPRNAGAPEPASGHKRNGAHPCQESDPPSREDCFIPDGSRYLHGSIRSLRGAFLSDAPEFQLVVLDPPWPNRSARRKRSSYATARDTNAVRALLSLVPVASHLAPDGLLAVWVTNKATFAELLTAPRGLFDEWGVEPLAEWTWLKVAADGRPVVHVDSQWRKPWERLLIARRKGSGRTAEQRVLVSVPDVHSRKPNLRALFAEVLGLPEYPALEVFARNLTVGWWGWGDEVLTFQGREHWVDVGDAELGC